MPEYCPATGKVSHATKRKAVEHKRQIKRVSDRPVNVFFCAACGGFHVGRERRFTKPLNGRRRE